MIITHVLQSATIIADLTDVIPLSAFEEATFEARENALYANLLREWWDEFWNEYALTAARKNRRKI